MFAVYSRKKLQNRNKKFPVMFLFQFMKSSTLSTQTHVAAKSKDLHSFRLDADLVTFLPACTASLFDLFIVK